MRTTIVSRMTGRDQRPVKVYQIRQHDNGTVEAFWYGANDALAPFNPQPTPEEADVYLARARNAPDGRITTLAARQD